LRDWLEYCENESNTVPYQLTCGMTLRTLSPRWGRSSPWSSVGVPGAMNDWGINL